MKKIDLTNWCDTVELFSQEYKQFIPADLCFRSLIKDIVLYVFEFIDDTENLINISLELLLKGIRTNFKYSYKITLSI